MELMIMVLLHKTDDSEWTEEELSPIKELENHGGYIFIFSHGATITLHNDDKYEIDLRILTGKRSC